MRHRVAGTKFNVDKDHRDSLLKNLLTSYIKHEHMVSTEAKVKAVKSLFDKLVTRAKKNDLQARRLVGSIITDRDAFVKLFDVLIPKFTGRSSGYSTTQMLIGARVGDSSKMMRIQMMLDAVPEKKVTKKAAKAEVVSEEAAPAEEKKTTRKRAVKKAE